MDTLQQVMLVMMLFFWIPSIAYIVIKHFEIKQSEVVIGKVVNIEPVYRGARYTLEMRYGGKIESTTISPNTAFQQYRMNDEIELYRLEKNGYTTYSIKGSNYTVAVVAMTVSFLFFISSLSR